MTFLNKFKVINIKQGQECRKYLKYQNKVFQKNLIEKNNGNKIYSKVYNLIQLRNI